MTILYDLPAEEYHRDLSGPTLSSTCANDLLNLSPAHARHFHPQFGRARREVTDEMDRGSLIDTLLLGNGRDIVEVDADSWRTNAAKAARDAAREAGKIAVLKEKLEDATIAAGEISAKLLRAGIHLSGKSQVALFWEHALESGAGAVKCRALLDHLIGRDGGFEIWDLKTIASAKPEAIQKAVELRGYHVQAAAYTEAIEHEFPAMAGRVNYGLIFAEATAPYAVTPVKLGGDLQQIGAARWEKACGLWHRCLTTNEWPDYAEGQGVLTVNASRWAMAQYEEDVING
jgi:hypothetical protein